MAGSTAQEAVLVDKKSQTTLLQNNRERTRIKPEFSSENANQVS